MSKTKCVISIHRSPSLTHLSGCNPHRRHDRYRQDSHLGCKNPSRQGRKIGVCPHHARYADPLTSPTHFPLITSTAGLLSEANLSLVTELPIEQLVVTNTVPQTQHQSLCPKLITIDISPTIAESIRRTHNGESISLLFGEWAEQGSVPIFPNGNGHTF